MDDLKSQYEAYEASKRIHLFADKETAERLNIEIGSEYTIFPPPTTKEEAFERLTMYTGLIHLESYISLYKSKLPLKLRPLQDELKTLTDFIDEADKLSTSDAFKGINIIAEKKFHYEYLKFKHGYYENLEYNNSEFFTPDAVFVFGKYFLYKEWLEEEIRKQNPLKGHTLVQDHKNKLKSLEQINPKRDITIFERIKRELNTIQWIFASQTLKKDKDLHNLLNEDGRYCRVINIRSDRQLNLIEDYKQHYTDRFEKANTRVVVKNELIEIYRTALLIIKVYEKTVSYQNPIIKELFDSYTKNPSLLNEDLDFRTMIILVVDYQPYNIIFGYDSNSNDYGTVFTIRDFNYETSNDDLVDFCFSLINFINTFEIPELQIDDNADKMGSLKDHLKVEIVNRSENPELFEESKSVEYKSQYVEMIQDHLEEIHFANDGSYQNLVSALDIYFDLGVFPMPYKQINFNRVNKKKIGWALNNIYREAKPNQSLSLEYLKYAKENLSLFKQYPLDESNFRKSNLYKMFTQKP